MSAADTAKVELLYPHTDRAGKSYDAGKTVELPADEAHQLIHFGRAITPESKTDTKAATTAKESK